MIEKVPVIIAWLPTTAARIAITKTGHLSFSKTITQVSHVSGNSFMNNPSTSDEFWSEILTGYRDVKPDMILHIMVLRKIRSLPHVRED